MWRYLKEAFWVGWEVPGLGKLPVNCLAVAGFGILGFGNPGFWLLGIALETAFLFSLATHPRFQAVIDAQNIEQAQIDTAAEKGKLLATLDSDARQRLETLEKKCRQAMEILSNDNTKEFLVEGNRDALQKLTWIYLKLLVAQRNLLQTPGPSAAADLEQKIARIKNELDSVSLSSTLRESKTATLRITEQRLENIRRRDQSLSEVESDLTRIEEQIDLAVENARIRDHGEIVSGNIDLASQLLDDTLFGDSKDTVAALEKTYTSSSQTPPMASS